MKKNAKLTLNKETLRGLGLGATGRFDGVNDSCDKSCYLQTCGCTVSTEVKTQVEVR
jgi:hypothetical protein